LLRALRTPEQQIQPNGVDLTVASLWTLDGGGSVGVDNQDRVLPSLAKLNWEPDGWLDLGRGPYLARLHEVVDLPTDLMAFGQARSSLLRSGVVIHNAVWDAGYTGRSEVLLVVCNDLGFRVQRGARILQLVFCRLEGRTTPYAGRFQGENLGLD
jgi:dUTP pyrophosphatase